jgi:hypothetical protein
VISRVWSVLLAVVVGGLIAGCEVIPAPMLGGEAIVMDVANRSARPATLAVAAPGEERKIVGSAAPAIVPPHTTVTVRFVVPPTGQWAIWANGGELMGSFDVKERRGKIPMGIDIDEGGSPGWWCQGNCP